MKANETEKSSSFDAVQRSEIRPDRGQVLAPPPFELNVGPGRTNTEEAKQNKQESLEQLPLHASGGFVGIPPNAQDENNPSAIQAQLGKGQGLDAETQTRMEGALGGQFGGVRIHNDARSAQLSKGQNARAFTIGQDVAFNAGEYKPGTQKGDILLAHELAHVQQQKGGTAKEGVKFDEKYDALEQDADRSAEGAVSHLWGGSAKLGTGSGGKAPVGTDSGLRLQKWPGSKPLVDQHAGAERPNAERMATIKGHIETTEDAGAGVGPAPDEATAMVWDGAMVEGEENAEALEARTALTEELWAALEIYIDQKREKVEEKARSPRVPIKDLKGPGRAAKKEVDNRYAGHIKVAGLTGLQAVPTTIETSGMTQNLFDANDPEEREKAGSPLDILDLVRWIGSTDPEMQAIQRHHGFNPYKDEQQGTFFNENIVLPFAEEHEAFLTDFELFGFAKSGMNIIVGTDKNPKFSDEREGSVPSDAERNVRWRGFRTIVHEYLHQVTHPQFEQAARLGKMDFRILIEGFTQMYTGRVLRPVLENLEGLPKLRKQVEGGKYPMPSPEVIGEFNNGDYAGHVEKAEAITEEIGENAAKAAYFQGHTEFLGLDEQGNWTEPVNEGSDWIRVPVGIDSLADLAKATGVSEETIIGSNPDIELGDGAELPEELHIPGCRDHIVIQVSDRYTTASETKKQIAQQNGVKKSALKKANPGVDWNNLEGGDHILIPAHTT